MWILSGAQIGPRRADIPVNVSIAEPTERPDAFREKLLEQALSLPLGDRVALARVVALCEQPAATPQDVALEAGRDESFAAILLRLANSAFSGSVTRVADLYTAITRLGFRQVQALALSIPGMRLLETPHDGLELARRELHRHAIRVGLAARAIAPAGVGAERALAAGILHNLGLNVISLYARDEFRHLLEACRRGEQFREAEDWIFGFSHADLGAMLAERWSYPAELVVAIRDHDSPEPQSMLGWVVQVADLLVRSHGVGVEPPRPLPENVPLPGFDVGRAHTLVGDLVAAQNRFDDYRDDEH